MSRIARNNLANMSEVERQSLVALASRRLAKLIDFGGDSTIPAVYGDGTIANVRYANDVTAVAHAFVQRSKASLKDQQNPLVADSGTVDDDIVITLANGNKIKCGPGNVYQHGGSLSVIRGSDNSEFHWEAAEWQEDPELVIGAVFRAAIEG